MANNMSCDLFFSARDGCMTANGDCHAKARCVNTAGTITCFCNDGYSGNGKTCNGLNECYLRCHFNLKSSLWSFETVIIAEVIIVMRWEART